MQDIIPVFRCQLRAPDGSCQCLSMPVNVVCALHNHPAIITHSKLVYVAHYPSVPFDFLAVRTCIR